MDSFQRRSRNTRRMAGGVIVLAGIILVVVTAEVIALALSLASLGMDGIAEKIGHAAGRAASAFDDGRSKR